MSRVLNRFGAGAMAVAMCFGGVAGAQTIDYGVELPNPGIADYKFPAPEAELLTAVDAANTADIYNHGWGLWTSLTTSSGRTAYGIQNAPVYLTWLTKNDLATLSKTPAQAPTFMTLASGQTRTLGLGPVTQLRKFGIDSTKAAPPKGAALKARAVNPDTSSFETVAYNPTAARYIHDQGLFKLATLQGLYKAGSISQVPAFPATAVAIKPVYKIISSQKLINGRYYAMPAWRGTPVVTTKIIERGFGEKDWEGCVYVDIQNTGTSTSTGIDGDCSRPTPGATYGLGDFIRYAVTAANVSAFNAEGYKVAIGDQLLLMAMHVTSRELTEWTWQTFFWAPAPMNPPLPSSDDIAAAQPKQLTGPAAHYAMSIAYQMISPNQPLNGGTNTGKPSIAYNPYLEAGFNAKVFGVTRPVTNPNTSTAWTGQVGVETNCMTCHAMAAVAFGAGKDTPYGTTFYVARDDSMFINTVQTDFLWSIADYVSSLKPKKK